MEYYIYTLKDPRSNEIRYVGKTKDLKDRYNRHLQKCYLEKYDKNTYKSNWIKSLLKENFKPIMEVLDVGDIDNINELEIYWIEQLKQWNIKLTNLSEGGEIGVDWSGRKHKKSSVEKMIRNQPHRREVIHYDLDGNILGEYFSVSEASKKTGCHIYLLTNCCKKKKYYTVNDTTFRYKGDVFDYIPYNKHIQVNSKSVIKYDLDGNFIERYDSTKQAARVCKSTSANIVRCCKNKYKTDTHGRKTNKPIVVKGYIFRYESDEF